MGASHPGFRLLFEESFDFAVEAFTSSRCTRKLQHSSVYLTSRRAGTLYAMPCRIAYSPPIVDLSSGFDEPDKASLVF